MKKESIITLPHASLRTPSRKVGLVTKEIKQLILDMESAVIDWDKSRPHELTVALAAVQVNALYRVVIVREDFSHRTAAKYVTFINPTITKYEGSIEEDFEGCLSIKDISGKVPRHTKIRIKAYDLEGKEFSMKADGYLARVFQHEIDHTKGIVYIDHIKDNPDAFYELKKNGELEKLDYEKDVRNNSILW